MANYVTPRHLALLHEERATLEAERARLHAAGDGDGRKRDLAVIAAGRLAALDARIASAKVVDPTEQPRDEVRFGATVTLRAHGTPGEERHLALASVD